MKIGINLVMVGLLSLLVGSAFASPLLMTELDPENIKPYVKPPAYTALTSDVTSEVLYANFSVTPNVESDIKVNLSYFVVLNVTNNSDEPANVSFVTFDAQVQDYALEDNSGDYSRSESSLTWTAKEAWVDGVYYNISWVPNNIGAPFEECFDYQGDPDLEGEWIEGVKIQEYYINFELAYTKINMNGTWVDVTGRIDVERPYYWPLKEQPGDEVLIWDIKNLLRESELDNHSFTVLEIPPRGTPEAFNEIWAPHESRLIAVHDARPVESKSFEDEKLEKLKTEEIVFNTVIQSQVTVDNWTDFARSDDSIQVFVEPIGGEGYQYSVLPADTVFTLDEFGVEVFIESRD